MKRTRLKASPVVSASVHMDFVSKTVARHIKSILIMLVNVLSNQNFWGSFATNATENEINCTGTCDDGFSGPLQRKWYKPTYSCRSALTNESIYAMHCNGGSYHVAADAAHVVMDAVNVA